MVVAGAVSQALGQDWHGGTNWSPPLLHTNWPNLPPPNWTNFPAHTPPAGMDKHGADRGMDEPSGRIIPPVSPSVPSHVNSPQTPADVQTTIQQFQQSRQALMNQLESATEEQRQAILGAIGTTAGADARPTCHFAPTSAGSSATNARPVRQQSQSSAQPRRSCFAGRRPEWGWPASAVEISRE